MPQPNVWARQQLDSNPVAVLATSDGVVGTARAHHVCCQRVQHMRRKEGRHGHDVRTHSVWQGQVQLLSLGAGSLCAGLWLTLACVLWRVSIAHAFCRRQAADMLQSAVCLVCRMVELLVDLSGFSIMKVVSPLSSCASVGLTTWQHLMLLSTWCVGTGCNCAACLCTHDLATDLQLRQGTVGSCHSVAADHFIV